jgi:hypothetical protein
MQRQVDKYLAALGDLGIKDLRSIIRYYVSMASACMILQKSTSPTDKDLAGLLATVSKPLDPNMLAEATALVVNSYADLGKTDTVAKGPDMREKILKQLAAKFAGVGTLGI